jgi:hypothetical protein
MISLPILWPQDKIAAFCEQWAIAELSLLGGPNSLDRSKAQLSETLLQSAVH